MACRTARGAVTVENKTDSILSNTEEMIKKILEVNNIAKENIVSMFFTCTRDLDAVYPAVAARNLEIIDAGLMCAQEMYVEGSMKKCIRVLVSFETDLTQKEIRHIYLGKAAALRPDLGGKK